MAQKNGTRVAAKARAYRALEMKVAGATDRQIAETEGVSATLINRDIKRVIGELATNGNAAINADEIRFIQMERLNKISWLTGPERSRVIRMQRSVSSKQWHNSIKYVVLSRTNHSYQ